MIDILFLAKNRLEFTKVTLRCLIENTNWSLVRDLWLVDDCSTDGTAEFLSQPLNLIPSVQIHRVTEKHFGGPVAIMNYFIAEGRRARQNPVSDVFAKIDNDTAVPPGWLTCCTRVMEDNPELDLLGIEPMGGRPVHFGAFTAMRTVEKSQHIGGIGLMRSRIFKNKDGWRLPVQSETFFGFTHFQHSNDDIKRGWLTPALPVALLDRLPIEPFQTLTRAYIERKWARGWSPYGSDQHDIWSWLRPQIGQWMNPTDIRGITR